MIRKLLLALFPQDDGDKMRKRLAAEAERFIQWQRELLIENPNDPPQFWRWKK